MTSIDNRGEIIKINIINKIRNTHAPHVHGCVGKKYRIKDMKISDPYDPEDNIEAGTRYLRYLLNRFDGSLKLALAAYNAGPSRVERSGGIPRIS